MKNVYLTLVFILCTAVSTQANNNIRLTSRILDQWENVQDICISGDYAYIASGLSGLQIVDVSDPQEPQLAGVLNGDINNANCVDVDGHFVYLSESTGNIYKIDVEDVENPQILSQFVNLTAPKEIYFSSDRLYVLEWDEFYTRRNSGLHVINMDAVNEPRQVGQSLVPREASSIAIQGDIAYVTDIDHDNGGMHIYDVSNRDSPRFIRSYNEQGWERGILMNGDVAYLGCSDEYSTGIDPGIMVLDIGDPTNPEMFHFIETARGVTDMAIVGNYLVAAENTRNHSAFETFIIGEWGQIDHASTAELDIDAGKMVVLNQWAMITAGEKGVSVLDITDPEDPREAAPFPFSGSILSIDRNNEYLYTIGNKLNAITFDEPENPNVWTNPDRMYHREIVTGGERGCIINEYFSITVLDLSEPDMPLCGDMMHWGGD